MKKSKKKKTRLLPWRQKLASFTHMVQMVLSLSQIPEGNRIQLPHPSSYMTTSFDEKRQPYSLTRKDSSKSYPLLPKT